MPISDKLDSKNLMSKLLKYDHIIDFVNIASAGNASDFGDMTTNTDDVGGLSNAHGGLAA